jgi:hypothetical protein
LTITRKSSWRPKKRDYILEEKQRPDRSETRDHRDQRKKRKTGG